MVAATFCKFFSQNHAQSAAVAGTIIPPITYSLSPAFLCIREEIVMEIESDEIDAPLDECFRSEEASYIVDRHVLWP
jgi:hypothetical protein